MTNQKNDETPENAPWQEATNDTETTSDDEWNEVPAEQQIVLDKEGDKFTAKYLGMDQPHANGIKQGHFTDLEGFPPGGYFLNLTKDLEYKMKQVPDGSKVRLTWTHSLDTGQKTKMRIFTVQWR